MVLFFQNSVEVSTITKDSNDAKLSKEQRIAKLNAESPELLAISADLKDKAEELKSKINLGWSKQPKTERGNVW